MMGTCDNNKICNTDGICYVCVKTASLLDMDPGCNAQNPHCQASDGSRGTTCVCTASNGVCDIFSSSVCSEKTCKCGVDEACSSSSTTPKCLEPSSVPAIPTAGSTTAKCHVIYLFRISHLDFLYLKVF